MHFAQNDGEDRKYSVPNSCMIDLQPAAQPAAVQLADSPDNDWLTDRSQIRWEKI